MTFEEFVRRGQAAQAAVDALTGKRIDHIGPFAVGVPTDIGWAIVTVFEDRTVTRVCKGCGVSVTTGMDANGKVAEADIHHRHGCTVVDRLGNNPVRS